MSADKKHIAYLGKGEYEDGRAYRCGAIVVTLAGEPREFRCTSPVRPNQLQRITYGVSLEPHMYVEVMGKPLIQALQETVSLYMVDDPVLLNLREVVDQPVVFARRQGIKSNRQRATKNASALVPSPTGDFDPVVIEAFAANTDDIREASVILEEASANLDVLEPFDRLELALAKVHEAKELDK